MNQYDKVIIVFTDSVECKLERLSWSLNLAEEIADFLSKHPMPRLDYLNLRKTKVSPAAVGKLVEHCGENGIGTVVLDGIKLSGSDAISKLLGKIPNIFVFKVQVH